MSWLEPPTGRLDSGPSVSVGSTSADSTNFGSRWLVESVDAEPADTEGPLYYANLYKGLEHQTILVSSGVLEPIPQGYWGRTVYISGACLPRLPGSWAHAALCSFLSPWFSLSSIQRLLLSLFILFSHELICFCLLLCPSSSVIVCLAYYFSFCSFSLWIVLHISLDSKYLNNTNCKKNKKKKKPTFF